MYISLCEPLSFPASSPAAICNGKSICRVADGKAEVYSDFVANTTNVEVNGAWMFVKGNQCREREGKAYKVSLRMGSPEFYTEAMCQVFLLWRTSAICPRVPGKPARTEVPCYVYDDRGSRFDLSGLIRASGGHRVETTDPSVDLRINVCSDMLPENEVSYPPLSGACLMSGGTGCTSVGEVRSGLKFQGQDLFLTYLPKEGALPMPGCDAAPRTTIKFVCPGRRNSHLPRLLSDMDCHYYIEWETQHACSLDQLSADVATCKFTGDTHGVDIDLSPLQKTDGAGEMQFDWVDIDTCVYNFVWETAYACPEVRATDCSILEDGVHIDLSPLSRSKGAVTTSPELVREVKSECLLEFEWHTAVACPRRTKIGTNCKVSNEQLGFELDLSPLNSLKPYEVEHKGYKYYLNVCGNLTGTPCNVNNQEAGICQMSIANGRAWVLGQANSNLTYIDGMVNLTYVNGTPYNDRAKTPRSSSVVFLCDYDAGIGRPEFLDEANRTYSFVWYTSYACPPSYFTGCVYRDPETNLTYDLSRLNQVNSGGDWFVEEKEMGFTRRFHLSVCRPLRRAPLGCSSRAAACVVNSYDNGTEVVAVGNAGQARHSPTRVSGTISLEYDMGEPCVSFGKNTNYTTVMHFLCDARQAESLHLLTKGKCRYTFLWVTHMACPVSHLEARGSCSLTDRAGTTYNLASLHLPHSFYTVTDGDVVYELNICGPVHGGHCSKMANTSVCRVAGSNVTQLARTDFMALTSDDPGSLRLSYAGSYTNQSAKASLVLIEVTCDRGAANHRLAFGRSEPGLLVFNLATVLACEPVEVDCTFGGPGYRYDLTPLVRRVGNWDIPHPTSPRLFHLSFCRPLNPSTFYSCPPGVASCETDSLHPEKAGISWGVQTDSPFVARDSNTVIIQYRSGSPCKRSNDTSELQVSRSTIIALICSEEEQPIVVGESKNCELVFNFETPAACPLMVAEGDKCKVKDRRYGYVYDLSSLANATSDYEVSTANFTYLINVCRPLVTDLESCKGAAMCQTKPTDANFGMHAGLPSSAVTYKNGLITLTYSEGYGGCKGINNRSTVITFVCDHSASGRQGPAFVSESEECTYAFEWRTSLACPPIVESECSVQLDNDGGMVDLSPLSNPRENYIVSGPDGSKYVLNVCRSVVYSPGATCENTAGACVVSHPQNSRNQGQVLFPPYVENGRVMLKYSSGDYCNSGMTARLETVIEFICDKNIRVCTIDLVSDCTTYFQWRTTFACSMKDDIVFRNCTALHPLTGEEFDLTPLKSAQPYNVTFKDDAYSLSICGPLPDNLCGPGAGEAGGGGAVSLGLANADIHFREGVMFLEYTEGDTCPGGAGKRSSVVQFACAMAGYSHLGPQLVHVASDCTYYFIWHTERACRRVLHCTVEEGTERFDLSSLTKSTGRHTVRNMVDPGYVYYINVCRPLHAVAPYHTLANAGLVRVSRTTGAVEEEPILLDIDEENCVFVFEWRTNLVCPEVDRKAVPSAGCTFSIPQHGLSFDLSKLAPGNSSVLEKYACHSVFTWKTDLVCVADTQQCTVSSGDDFYDLGLLSSVSHTWNVTDPKGNIYWLSICSLPKPNQAGSHSCPSSAAVCMKSVDHRDADFTLGKLASQKIKVTKAGEIQVSYGGGDPYICLDRSTQHPETIVNLVCDPSGSGLGSPEFVSGPTKDRCAFTFHWKSRGACAVQTEGRVLEKNGIIVDRRLNLAIDFSSILNRQECPICACC
ncbi:mannose-6-phosphate/insulin receptor type II, putative [Ixodes scapularis]|uniref:Mannose-6-phosphate/insulin receptor type II, putative n=1 Tax=Ixodes scapularis TaxID=6945 RepID=B7QN48_IXOSC|nr:mannose-6-phosphate/insulin receptor type II, putative [Ixodes scapularis]|eukprot:XP_002400684.1 mannose-6-phosphate/insulin receptor type II, putative [Ixodes scapularis]